MLIRLVLNVFGSVTFWLIHLWFWSVLGVKSKTLSLHNLCSTSDPVVSSKMFRWRARLLRFLSKSYQVFVICVALVFLTVGLEFGVHAHRLECELFLTQLFYLFEQVFDRSLLTHR